MEESAKSLDQQSNSNTSTSPKLEEHVDNHNHNCDHLDHQQHQHQHQHPHLQHQHQHQQHLHHAAEGEGHHFHKDANVEHGSVLENHPHHLHHSPEETSAHHQHAHDAQQAALTSNMQHGGHYPPLTNEQLQAINTNPSVAQAHALQQQIQQHLQQQLQSPFPFAYQTPLPPLPPAGGMPQGLAGGVEDAQQIKARPKRKQVKSACLNCRKRKTGCDAFRPCTKCTRNGLESTCVDVPRKKRSSNRAKTNATVTPLSAGSSSPSPSSSPALGVAPSPAPTFASPLSSQLQYMSVNMGQGCIPTSNGIPMPQQTQYSPQLIPMTWGAPNGAQTHYVPMTWEEITKHVASAQNNGGPGNVPLQLPQELAWKGSEGLGQPGMTPVEQSK